MDPVISILEETFLENCPIYPSSDYYINWLEYLIARIFILYRREMHYNTAFIL
jgi:hypothetical protein